MILRTVTLVGAVSLGAATSQFPEYSQQYMQRLGGAVDELGLVVADFDASAAASGLSREAALQQMQGAEFIERRRGDMTRSFARHARLRADLAALQGQGPFMRAYHAVRFTDRDLAGKAWQAFQPALPLNLAGGLFAGVGFLLGLLGFGILFRVLALPFKGATPKDRHAVGRVP